MKKELKILFVILCTLALVTGVQAQDEDPHPRRRLDLADEGPGHVDSAAVAVGDIVRQAAPGHEHQTRSHAAAGGGARR